MQSRFLAGAISAALILFVTLPARSAAQSAAADTIASAPLFRPLETVVVTANRPSALDAAMARFAVRASIDAKQRENRRLARQVEVQDGRIFTLERHLDSLMIAATIQELHITRTVTATEGVRAERLRMEARLCEADPAECAAFRASTGGSKGI